MGALAAGAVGLPVLRCRLGFEVTENDCWRSIRGNIFFAFFVGIASSAGSTSENVRLREMRLVSWLAAVLLIERVTLRVSWSEGCEGGSPSVFFAPVSIMHHVAVPMV